jgi:hypothetical protein
MYTIELTTTKLEKNPNTKTTYNIVEKTVEVVDEEKHRLATCDETVKWFRRRGGKETVTRAYTCAGFKVVKVVITSPCKQLKTIREYNFKQS